MVPDWTGNHVFFSEFPGKHYPALWSSLQIILKRTNAVVNSVEAANENLWLRDFFPIQLGEDQFLKFRYEPNYLENGFDHWRPDENIFRSIPILRKYKTSSINLDGGNVVASQNRVILTEKVFRENPEFSPRDLRMELQRLFQVDECIFISPEPDDIFGHADGSVRFINDNTVLINDYAKVDKGYGKKLKAVLRKHCLEYQEIPYFIEHKTSDGIPSAVGNYVNYLATDKVIIVPVYGVPEDEEARRKLEDLFPGRAVVPLMCNDLARQGGVLRCASWAVWSNTQSNHPLVEK